MGHTIYSVDLLYNDLDYWLQSLSLLSRERWLEKKGNIAYKKDLFRFNRNVYLLFTNIKFKC